MARKQNIRFLMKNKLQEYEAYGTSKHELKNKTNIERRAAKKAGVSNREALNINYLQDKIVSINTMKTYQREADKYANWLEARDMKKINMDEAKTHIQEYITDLTEQGKSAWSINTALSALCKTFQTCAADYVRPKRHAYEIIRSTNEVARDKLNEKRCKDIMEANRILGLRRSEEKNIRPSDFMEYDRDGHHIIELTYKGKGGKNCHNFYYDKESQDFIHKLLDGKKPDEKVFSEVMKQFNYDCDLHSCRREAAINLYNYVLDHPEERDFFMAELKRSFEERHKILPANLDTPYKLRGENKKAHEEMGLPTEVDKFAALVVSTQMLNHYRISVSVLAYILHP